jgi:hypothetical protein
MYKMKKFLLIVSLVTSFYFSAHAQGSWRKLSDLSNLNSITNLSVGKDGIIYAVSTDRWVYYSEDHGNHWKPFANVHNWYNLGILNASKSSNRLFAKTSYSGLAWTDDFGKTWKNENFTTDPNTGFGEMIFSIGLHATENKILISTLDAIFPKIESKLRYSNDNGNTYQNLKTTPFIPIGFDYISNSDVYAYTAEGIFHSSDLFKGNWTFLEFKNQEVINVQHNSKGELLAAVNDKDMSTGIVYSSSNKGDTWKNLPPLPKQGEIKHMALDEVNNFLYVTTAEGIFMYNGTSWKTILNKSKISAFAITAQQHTMFGGLRIVGTHKADPKDFKYQPVNTGITQMASMMKISADNQIYCASEVTAFVSKFDISTLKWSNMHLYDSMESTRMMAMTKDKNGDVIVSGIRHISKFSNRGQDISLIADNMSAPHSTQYKELTPIHLFAGNDGSISMMQRTMNHQVEMSLDEGKTWKDLYNSTSSNVHLTMITKVCTGTKNHYISGRSSTTSKNVAIESIDGGNTWKELAFPSNQKSITKIFIDRFDQLYAMDYSNLYSYNSITEEWTQLNINLLPKESNKVVELKFDYNNKMYVLYYSKTGDHTEEGIFFSGDKGLNFNKIEFPQYSGKNLRLSTIEFNRDNILFGVTIDNGTNDKTRAGIYYFSDKQLNSVQDVNSDKTSVQVYPNPINNYFNISCDVPVRYLIIDLTGKVLQKGVVEKGLSTVSLNSSSFASGIYLLKIEGENFHQTRKVLISNN